MEEKVNFIKNLFDNFIIEARKNVDGNKAAGTRARRTSLEIEKALKDYRKASIEASRD